MLIALGALCPPLVFALVLARLAAGTTRSWTSAAVALLWGAVVAANVALAVNDRTTMWATTHLGDERGHVLVTWAVAPLIEELAKASGFLAIAFVARRPPPSARAGAVLGALIGLGFAAVENVTYYTLAAVQGGYDGLARAVFLRGLVEGLNHATFTAITGLAIGWAAASARSLAGAAALGLAGAALVHAAWNAIVSGAIVRVLCNAPTPDAACARAPDAVDLFVTAPLLVLATMGPIVLGLAAVLRRVERQHRDALPAGGRKL